MGCKSGSTPHTVLTSTSYGELPRAWASLIEIGHSKVIFHRPRRPDRIKQGKFAMKMASALSL